MKPISVVLTSKDHSSDASIRQFYSTHELVDDVIEQSAIFSGEALNGLLASASTEYILFVLPGGKIEWTARGLDRLYQVAKDSHAGLVYCDYRDVDSGKLRDHPLIDYQTGSIRDTFDFGGAYLVSTGVARNALERTSRVADNLKSGSLYDLRLKISEFSQLVRCPEFLYLRHEPDRRDTGERIFDYVNPAQRSFQIEMEEIASSHLERKGAYLEPQFKDLPQRDLIFPVVASVVIPVRNRVATILDAVESALSQKTSFDFNVIIVDNHSTDGTEQSIADAAGRDSRVRRLVPERFDLGIGGCWNEAIYSSECGRYAVQLDSDDIYSSAGTLETIVQELRRGPNAMVIGSYTTVDFDLVELPPGVVDHREWTEANGRNNALRINGLGAPRAFDVGILREFGFPNVSYGEDYAVALRISREYRIGRIYESIYLARRWRGNSDSALPLETMNRYDAYKDWIRSQEIAARMAR
jgi:Glycosyl transferase family 2